MKKEKKYLKLYEQWMETGRIPAVGLCYIFGKDKLFKLMNPSTYDIQTLKEEGNPHLFWGRGNFDTRWGGGGFSPLRQTIVLFMAAMNGEL